MTRFPLYVFQKFFKVLFSVASFYFSISDISLAKKFFCQIFEVIVSGIFFSKLKLFRKMKRSLGEMLEARK